MALAALAPLGHAGEAARAALSDPDRIVESKSLHRRLDLRGLEVWDQKAGVFRPFTAPRRKVLVITLWAKSCRPCMQEMPELARLARLWRTRREVAFLLVATPPAEMTQDSVKEFFRRRIYEARPGEPCPGQPAATASPNLPRQCELEMPAVEPLRSRDERLEQGLGSTLKPITLLVDEALVVRHAFVGSVAARSGELSDAVERLVAAHLG